MKQSKTKQEYYVTPEEHKQLRAYLEKLRTDEMKDRLAKLKAPQK